MWSLLLLIGAQRRSPLRRDYAEGCSYSAYENTSWENRNVQVVENLLQKHTLG